MSLPILVVLSSAHEVLFERYFRPSLPAGLTPQVLRLADNKSDGSFLSSEWQEAMCAKVKHALDFCRSAAEGELFIVSDVDVQFFPEFESDDFRGQIECAGVDLLFQKERFRAGDTEVCCGFYAARNTPAVRTLLERALHQLTAAATKNEQVVVNALLRELPVSHAVLDARFYARTHGFPPPREIWLHHANWTAAVPEKIRQLERVRRIRCGGFLRLHGESYNEHVSRALLKEGGLRGWLNATRDYVRRLPLQPGCLP